MARFRFKYCSPFKNHQELLNSLGAFNSCSNSCSRSFTHWNWIFQTLELDLSEQSMQILPSQPELKFPVQPREPVQTSPPRGGFPGALLCRLRALPAQAQTLMSCWCSMETAGDGWGTVRWEIPKCQTAYRLLLPWDPTVNISLISYPTGWYSHGWHHAGNTRAPHNTPAQPCLT